MSITSVQTTELYAASQSSLSGVIAALRVYILWSIDTGRDMQRQSKCKGRDAPVEVKRIPVLFQMNRGALHLINLECALQERSLCMSFNAFGYHDTKDMAASLSR